MNKEIVLAVSLAAMSWLFSLLVFEAYVDPTWQCLASLALVDFIFMVIFYYSNLNNQKVRWVCSLLALSAFFTLTSSIVYYSYHYGIIESDFFAVNAVISYYGSLSFVLSLLIMIVSALNDRIMDKIDGLFWPGFARAFRFNFDVGRSRNFNKGAF